MENMNEQLVNIRDPDTGEIGSLPASQVGSAQQMGYEPVSNEEAAHYVKTQKFEQPLEQAKTLAEGAGRAATFGLSTGLETALGANPEDIQARREINPGMSMLGEGAGLIGSALIPGGAANIMERAGAAGAGALGLGAEGAGIASRIGSTAVKSAIENAMFQSGDEVSKMLSKDPSQSVETAISNVGLSGLLGGAIGAGAGGGLELWKSTAGPKVNAILDAISKKAGGIDGQLPDEVLSAIDKTGIEVAPEVKAALSNNEYLRQTWQMLQEGTEGSAMKAKEAKDQFLGHVSDFVSNTLGKDKAGLEALSNMSEDKIGQEINGKLSEYLKREFEPSIDLFKKFKQKYSNMPLTEELNTMADTIAEKMNTEFGLSPSSSEYKYGETLLKELPYMKTVTDIGKRQTMVWDEAAKGNISWNAAGKYVGILRDAEEQAIMNAAKKSGAKDVMDLQLARSSYRDAKEALDELNQHLKLKGYKGPDSFLDVLGEAQNEKILGKLSNENNAELLRYLQGKLPEVAGLVKEYHVNDLLKSVTKDGEINLGKLTDKINKMSPELREFALGSEAVDNIKAADVLTKALPERINPSGTARTLNKMWENVKGGAAGMAGMALSHGSPMGFLFGAIAGQLGKDVPDATRLAFLKFMGSPKEINAGAFKVLADYVEHVQAGESKLNNAVKSVFNAGKTTLSSYGDVKTDKLDKQVQDYQANLPKFFDVGNGVAHYAPEDASHMGQVAANTVGYLASLKPHPQKNGPLDKEFTDPVKERTYQKALAIAEKPLTVLGSVQAGTLTAQDVMIFKNLYPSLYDRLSQKMYNELVDVSAKGKTVPYSQRQAMSLFMGTPVDSTFSPQFILSNQAAHAQQAQQNQPGQARPSQEGMKGLSKLPKMYMNSLQSSQVNQME